MNFEFHPDVLAEYEAAIAYYAERDLAVARRFVAAFEDAIERIVQARHVGASWTTTCGGASREYSRTVWSIRSNWIACSSSLSCIAAASRVIGRPADKSPNTAMQSDAATRRR